jgi:hypothetical protein
MGNIRMKHYYLSALGIYPWKIKAPNSMNPIIPSALSVDVKLELSLNVPHVVCIKLELKLCLAWEIFKLVS